MRLNLETINQITANLNQPKILVVGDVMLDRYWFGEVSRISPEAPVPIAKINLTENRPGAAANVARNISSLGGQVSLLSVVGDDEASHELENLLAKENITTLLKRDTSISTIVKLRILARNQQLIRLDFEEKPSHEILAEVLDKYEAIIDDYELIILSDYGKGGLSHTAKMIEIAKQRQKKILLDPKGNDYSKYTNATLISPNKTELSQAIGTWNNEQELQKKALALKKKLKLKYILLTRSEEGMTLFGPSGVQNYPTVAREVYDVSGAGDTVIATLGLMLANNIAIEPAVLIANVAAGIVVGKIGTATVTKDELIQELHRFKG